MKFKFDRAVLLAIVAGAVLALIFVDLLVRWIGPLQMSF